MSTLQEHLALIRENWDRHDKYFEFMCWNLVRGHAAARGALAGINAAVVGVLAAALYHPIGVSAIDDPPSIDIRPLLSFGYGHNGVSKARLSW